MASYPAVLNDVPQESILGPLLFILYVNDILNLIQDSMKMFPDDTKVYSVIKVFMII